MKSFEFIRKEPNGGGYYLKINWGTLIGLVLTVVVALAGGAWHTMTSAQDMLDKKIEDQAKIVSINCQDIAVLKEIAATTKDSLKKLNEVTEQIRRDQLDYYRSHGFKTKKGE
jgi:hydroxymethylpyrimidine/phosphomethylpyrimidine kinase